MKKENKITNCHAELDSGSQAGRSMVEMLGVLAIIGVLSVAGIAGYTTAMRSYRTNEIVNAASMLYVMGMATNKGEGTGTLNYSDIGTNPNGATLSYNNKTVTINITDPDDCAMVKNKLGDKAQNACAAAASPATGYTLTVNFGENVVSMEYPDGKSCNTDSDCNRNGSWGTEWTCGYEIENVCGCSFHTCSSNSDYPGRCTSDEDTCCVTGKIYENDRCKEPEEQHTEDPHAQCTTAIDCGTGYWECLNGACMCDYTQFGDCCGYQGINCPSLEEE